MLAMGRDCHPPEGVCWLISRLTNCWHQRWPTVRHSGTNRGSMTSVTRQEPESRAFSPTRAIPAPRPSPRLSSAQATTFLLTFPFFIRSQTASRVETFPLHRKHWQIIHLHTFMWPDRVRCPTAAALSYWIACQAEPMSAPQAPACCCGQGTLGRDLLRHDRWLQ